MKKSVNLSQPYVYGPWPASRFFTSPDASMVCEVRRFYLEDAGSALLALATGGTMGFIMEFAENLILRLMEDPQERDRKMRDHLYKTKAAGKRFADDFSLPIRPYGFWTFERHNAQLRWDPQISHAAGRRDPYDEVLEQTYKDVSK